jgi:hypothetical protein
MLERPILTGMIGRWAYALIDYDLMYKSLHARRGRGIADFVVDHMIKGEKILTIVVYVHKILDQSMG